ncbi:MAG: DUF2177 family protein [Gemmatimonadetes bacterium]|nr:DUF2177 family protein [Gemmatimonadota bacterium]
MPAVQFLKLYAAAIVIFFAIDLTWLGVVAKKFYAEQMGHLLRPDVQWGPAILFYLIYVAAIVVLCVKPALERESVGYAVALGALFGLAAYAAFDLTSLALLKDFPVKGAVVDLIWGTVLTGSVAGLTAAVGRWMQAG